MIFKPYDCDIGVTINDINYNFDHVDSFVIENPERTRLVRGANSGNTTGIEYKEGVKEPKVVTISVLGMSVELFNLLQTQYKTRGRMDAFCVSRSDGSSKIAKNAILSQEPMQLSLDDSPESMQTALVFESFDVTEVHKS